MSGGVLWLLLALAFLLLIPASVPGRALLMWGSAATGFIWLTIGLDRQRRNASDNEAGLVTVRQFRASSVTTITNKERFDDVGPQDTDGLYEYAYHGCNYDITVGQHVFKVRIYDDAPGVATVISPTDARTLPEARELVTFLTSALGCIGVWFYCGSVGTYRPVDIRTLEFTQA